MSEFLKSIFPIPFALINAVDLIGCHIISWQGLYFMSNKGMWREVKRQIEEQKGNPAIILDTEKILKSKTND